MVNGPQSVPTQSEEILDDPVNMQAWDMQISPTGRELPPGRGTAKEGAQLYVQKDARDAALTVVSVPESPVA